MMTKKKLGRPCKPIAQHKLEGTYRRDRHDPNYVKKTARKTSVRPSETILRQKAEDAWQFFTWGYSRYDIFKDYAEAKRAWQLVKAEYYGGYPVGKIDKFGYIEYGPAAYWIFDCPGAPFEYEEIEGLGALDSHQHQRHLALQRWGIIPAGTPDPQLIKRAEEIERFYQTGTSGNLNFLPFPYGTKQEEMKAKFEEVKAERQAWIKLGYLKE
jgi:hypothetical protein